MNAPAGRWAGGLGLTRGVSWTLAGRVWSLGAGVITVGLVARALSPATQGAYYAVLSLLAAQVFAELGLNFVLVQRAARAGATLTRTLDRRVSGPAGALGDVGALLRFGTRWFLAGAVAFGVVGGIVGSVVLQRGAPSGDVLAPWGMAVVGATMQLASLGPLAVFEGMGFVAEVAMVRFIAGATGALGTWCALLAGAGLWAVAVAPIVAGLVTWIVTWERFGPAWRDLAHAAVGHVVAWRREVLPVQARIAVSWLSGYAVSQAPTALLFAAQRPEDAGRYGMSMTIASAVSTVASSWLYPSQPEFARLMARGDAGPLDRLFSVTLGRTVLAGAVLGGAVLAIVALLPMTPLATYASRVLPLGAMALLLAGILGGLLAAAFAAYARAGGGEPFVGVSVASAAALVSVVWAVSATAGASGVAAAYAAVQWGIGVTWGGLIFRVARRRAYQQHTP